jgi:hypothetical protein
MDDLIRSAELQLKLLNDDRVNAYVTYHDLRAVPRYSLFQGFNAQSANGYN